MTHLWRALIVLAFCVPLFVGLGKADLDDDEPIYSYAVEEMLVNGDWMTPRSIPQQTPFLEKPPLKFWLIAAGIRSGALPANEFGHRFWDALFGAIAFLYVFAIGKRLGGPAAGGIAALVLFVQKPLLFEHGLRSNNMEAALLLAYCGGIYHALAWSAAGTARARRWHLLAIGALFALAFMCKFLAAAFLPMILGVMLVVFPHWRRRALEDWRGWAAAVAVALLIIAPWFVYQTAVNDRFWFVIFQEHVFKRMTTVFDPGHKHPWHFYLVRTWNEMLANGSLPLIVIGLGVVIWHTIRRCWDAGVLLLTWFALPLLAISAGQSKLYHYVFPFLPPLAIAAGYAAVVLFAPVGSRFAQAGARLAVPERLGWLRHVLAVVGALAFAIAAWTIVFGRFSIELGGVQVLRNQSIMRPLIAALVLLLLAGRGKWAGRAAVGILVIAPLCGYVVALSRLDDGRAVLQNLRACLQQQQVSRVLAHGDPVQWRYVYYLRHLGWSQPNPPDSAQLFDHLTVPGREAPVLLHARDLDALPQFQSLPSVRFDGGPVLLLPGRSGACAH